MKDYKLLLAGFILLLLIFFIAVFTWLWVNNRKNMDPLPIMANENEPTAMIEDDENTPSNVTLHIQAEDNLQAPLDDIIVNFEPRYPQIKVVANYVPSNKILILSESNSSRGEQSDFVVGTDMIIANDSLSKERLAPLQAHIKTAQDKMNQNKANISKADEENNDTADNDIADKGNTETRTLSSYNYAVRNNQTLEGVILTDNTAAINFRNFLLSSVGQDILKKYDYHSIEGYKNSVDDLFNPSSQSKKASEDTSVSKALSNGK